MAGKTIEKSLATVILYAMQAWVNTTMSKTFHKNILRGKIKDRRDVGRGCIFGDPPLYLLHRLWIFKENL